MDTVNSKAYWDNRFQNQDWKQNCGPEQTQYFTRLFLENAPQWLIRYIRKNSLSVMDLGCAEGDGTKILASVWPGQVCGSDVSEAAIGEAAKKYPDVSFEIQDIFQLSGQWDVIFLSNVIEHFENPYSALSAACAHARSSVIVMVPFEENVQIPEHVARFTFDSIPVSVDGFQLVYHNDIMDYDRDKTYYWGQQMILVYSRDRQLLQNVSLLQSSDVLENWVNSGDYREFKDRYYALELEYGIAQDQRKILNNELYDARIRNEELRGENSAISSKNEQISQQIGESKARIEELSNTNAEANRRIEILSNVNAELNNAIAELNHANAEANSRIEELAVIRSDLEQRVADMTQQLQEAAAKYANLYAYSENRDLQLIAIQNSRSYRMLKKVQGSFLYRGTGKVLRKTIRVGKALITLNFKALRDEVQGPLVRAYLRVKAPMIERKLLFQLKQSVRNKDIIVFPPTIDWHKPLYQRPQQLANAYARKNGIAVIYITQNIKHDHVAVAEMVNENLWIISENYAKKLPQLTQNAKSVTVSISWTLNKHYLDMLKPDKVIYEYIDELEIFGGYGPEMEEDHLRFLKEADVSVCTATKLYNQAAPLAKNPLLSPNAGDYAFFAKTDTYEINPLIRDLVKPYQCVIGYYGALASWFDYEMVKTVARMHPEWLFLLVGVDYDGTIHKNGLEAFENIVYIPPQPYTELPSFLKAFDVASIPFVINEITLSTSPVKLFEYMAGGKPIIASKMPECLKYESVRTYASAEEFCSIIETYQAMGKDDPYWDLLKKDALDNTWDARSEEIIQALNKYHN